MKKSTSPDAFLSRTLWLTAITGGFVGIGVAVRFGVEAGFGFTVGLGWGIANFFALAALLHAKLAPPRGGEARNPAPGSGRRVALAGAGKIGLYILALVVLATGWVAPAPFAAGFSWLLIVILLRALGQWLVDRSARAAAGGSGSPRRTPNEDVEKP